MKPTPKPENEAQRLIALREFGILDTPPEQTYDEIVQLAADICGVPISLIVLVDESRQWFKAKVGISAEQTPREASFCSKCILEDGIMEVPDTLADERYRDNPLVTGEPHIRFYAGAPLITNSGYALGTLCVIDREPRELSEHQRRALKILSKQVAAKMELRIAHKRLAQKFEEVERTNQSLQNLFQVISHDLKSPFNGLLGITDLLANSYESLSSSEIRDLLTSLNQSSRETYFLLENLLEWSNLEAGALRFKPVEVAVLRSVNNAMEVHSASLERKGIDLQVEVSESVTVHADEAMMSSVIRNLISNAAKFSTKGSQIFVKASASAEGVEVEVADHGIGMSAEQIENAFIVGSSESNRGTGGENGSGIGLMLVQQFLAKHGSKLEIESEVGKGTTVRFTLSTKES